VRRLKLIAVAALAAILAGTVAAYLLNPPTRLALMEESGGQGVTKDGKPRLRGLTYTQVEMGKRKWTLAAEGVRYDEDSEVAYLEDVRVKFFTDKGGWITLRGDTGSYHQKTKLIVLKGGVHGQSDEGMHLETELLTYSEEKEEVRTDALVTISGDRFSVTGMGMVVRVPQQQVVLESQVDSVFIPQGKGPPPGATAEDEQGTS